MATNTATADDLGRRLLRPLTDAETGWAPTALDDAFRRIMVEVPAVRGRLDDPTLDPSDPLPLVVVQVQCDMVRRVLVNPDGILEEATDDYTKRLDAAVSTGALYVSDAERSYLSEAAGGGGGNVVTVRPAPVRWFPDRPGDYFPRTSTDTW